MQHNHNHELKRNLCPNNYNCMNRLHVVCLINSKQILLGEHPCLFLDIERYGVTSQCLQCNEKSIIYQVIIVINGYSETSSHCTSIPTVHALFFL